MVTTDIQPRQPGGNARGGEYAEKQNSAPRGDLMESATGSFAFPPSEWESEEHLIEFFTTAPISDRILSNADHAYRQWRQQQIDNAVMRDHDQWGEAPETIELAKRNPQEFRNQNKYRQAVVREQAEQKYPQKEVSPARLRTVLRAHQIYQFGSSLGEDAVRAKNLHRLKIRGEEKSVVDIVNEYHTLGWADRAMTENDLANTDALYRVAMILDAKDGIFNNTYEPSR